jgi:acyl-coenzyme A synthetase/AMP-(fatty) acid ligase
MLPGHPAVRDGGVAWQVSTGGDEVPCAFGELENSANLEAMPAFVAERLRLPNCAIRKMPGEIHFVQSVSRTASGKILRRNLRKLF